ncbi:MAG: glycosidase [Gammaproteobacteria bacterium]|nr:MAG: glycosidase [Gammaproteobacteria bacterium]
MNTETGAWRPAPLRVRRRRWKLKPDPTQVICRLHIPGGQPARIRALIERVLALSDAEATEVLAHVLIKFADRHRHFKRILEDHFAQVAHLVPPEAAANETRRLLIGAYFTMEYAVASAALFNPSMVLHPDQSGLEPGALRFVMSLRAVGEGHISSLVFRSGVITAGGHVLFDPVSDYVETPKRRLDPEYDKALFARKLAEMGAANDITEHLLGPLPPRFPYSALAARIEALFRQPLFDAARQAEAVRAVNWLAHSNYEVDFNPLFPISERVIFPVSEAERGGIEDARFVQFYDDDGQSIYYATYTAYDGARILPQLLETRDFVHFKVSTLNGRAAQNKGMALFPRRIGGRYAMLSRLDGENNYVMYSDNLHFWDYACLIQTPREPWELVQLGNCGSPLETHAGWLVITHGVGPMREYAIGAVLLDLDDPSRMIARLRRPLLVADEAEREGYVPNVVYSCGGLLHNGDLYLPYAMSDISSGLVSVPVDELLAAMEPV